MGDKFLMLGLLIVAGGLVSVGFGYAAPRRPARSGIMEPAPWPHEHPGGPGLLRLVRALCLPARYAGRQGAEPRVRLCPRRNQTLW